MPVTKLFMGLSFVLLILALLVGIFRLMSLNSMQTGILTNLYLLHPILMVFGFLASIVMTERVAGLALIPGLRDSKLSLAMVPSIILGVILETFGFAYGAAVLRYLGSALLAVGCMVFIAILVQLSTRTGSKLPFSFMILSVLSLLGAAILSGFSLPIDNIGFVMLLISFPLVFILGERVELTRFVSTASSTSRFRFALVLTTLAIAFFALGSLWIVENIADYVVLTGFVFLLPALLLVLMAEIGNLRVLSGSHMPLQQYVSLHTQIAYFWGLLGVILAIVYLATSYSVDLYDPFIHSLAVGFIGTMLLAHGPVILPSVTGRRLKSGATLTLFPLVFLTLGNVLRVGGDLLVLNFESVIISYTIALSGWLILACVVIFLVEILKKTEPGGRKKEIQVRS